MKINGNAIDKPQADVVTAPALELRVLSSQMTAYDTNSYQRFNKQLQPAGTFTRSLVPYGS